MTKWMNRGLALATMMIAACFMVGCDDGDGGGGGGGGTNAFVGTWLIQKEATEAYWVFFADGTFRKNLADQPLDGAVHFFGTYTVSGGTLNGSFTNPGIGDGAIECTIAANGTMVMDFIEYWHSPAKHVPCTGVRQ
ncbi:MAG: hypothetical protein FJ221_02160 [Lentisphaerae bacterium]|nr:hypothetical protein [Lentisphaerota bacterium]